MVLYIQVLAMAIATMNSIMQTATMMVVTVVDLVSTLNTAQNVNVLEEKLAILFLMHWLEMDIAKMKPTMLIAAMMVVTVVHLISTQNNALNAFAITRRHVQLELLILWLEMDCAKMKPTMLIATMMVVTVVALVLLLNTAQNAYVLEEKLEMLFLMH